MIHFVKKTQANHIYTWAGLGGRGYKISNPVYCLIGCAAVYFFGSFGGGARWWRAKASKLLHDGLYLAAKIKAPGKHILYKNILLSMSVCLSDGYQMCKDGGIRARCGIRPLQGYQLVAENVLQLSYIRRRRQRHYDGGILLHTIYTCCC